MILLAVEDGVVLGLLSAAFPPSFLEGDAGDCASGSENMRAPGDGCESHEGVCAMTLGIAIDGHSTDI